MAITGRSRITRAAIAVLLGGGWGCGRSTHHFCVAKKRSFTCE